MNRVDPVSQRFFQLSDDRLSEVLVPDVIEETLSETEEVWTQKVKKVDVEVHGVVVDALDVGEVDRPHESRGRDHADKHAHVGGLDNVKNFSCPLFTNVCNKLQCLSWADPSSLA
jgi:hypothetical protein